MDQAITTVSRDSVPVISDLDYDVAAFGPSGDDDAYGPFDRMNSVIDEVRPNLFTYRVRPAITPMVTSAGNSGCVNATSTQKPSLGHASVAAFVTASSQMRSEVDSQASNGF